MTLVIDASIAACWVLPDEIHPVADSARRRLKQRAAIVPSLWWFEVRNVLIVNERRGRIQSTFVSEALGLLRCLPLGIDDELNEVDLISLARTHRLTAYDASYLELAKRSRSALATLDKALSAAARAEGIALVADGEGLT